MDYIFGKIMSAYLKRLWWECIVPMVSMKVENYAELSFASLYRLSNGGTMSPVCRYFKAVECKRATDLEERRSHDLWMKFWFRVPTRTVPFVHWSWFIASDSMMPVSSIENRLLPWTWIDTPLRSRDVEFLEKIRRGEKLEIERNLWARVNPV